MLCSPLLKPQSEKPIDDIRMTEQSAEVMDNDIIASRSRYLYCYYCGIKLLSKAGKTNHENAHKRSLIREKRQKLSKKPRRVYTCKQCQEEFTRKRYLNDHMKTHAKIIECNFCHKTFKDRMSYEMHDAISDGIHYDSLNTPVHRTRSQSRLSCQIVAADTRPSSCDPGFYSLRGGSPLSDCDSGRITRSSMKRRAASTVGFGALRRMHKRRKAKSVQAWFDSDSYYTDDDDFDDSVSERSYATTYRSASPVTSVWSSIQSEVSFTGSNRYICSERNCMKTFPSLNWVTTHEMSEHKKLALFRCKECRKRFTTSKNLQQHRIDNHPNVVICVLCDHPQSGIAAIEEHFDLHQKHSVKCEICGKLFLSKHYLDEHLKQRLRVHKNIVPFKTEILLRVDRRETREITDINAVFEADSSEITDFSYSKLHAEEQVNDTFNNFVDDLPWRT